MVYQPPAGARDLLPLDVAQKRWIEDRLQQVYHRWGYHRIITSTIERLDTLMAGGAIDRSTVLQLQAGTDESLGLRPELTASIARAAVTRIIIRGAPPNERETPLLLGWQSPRCSWSQQLRQTLSWMRSMIASLKIRFTSGMRRRHELEKQDRSSRDSKGKYVNK